MNNVGLMQLWNSFHMAFSIDTIFPQFRCYSFLKVTLIWIDDSEKVGVFDLQIGPSGPGDSNVNGRYILGMLNPKFWDLT